MKGMTLLICGSRKLFPTPHDISDIVSQVGDKTGAPGVWQVIHGGAVGVDACVDAWARRLGIQVTLKLPDYGKHGKRAPLMRNDEMASLVAGMATEEKPAHCVAIWDGASRGALYMMRSAYVAGVPISAFLWQNGRYKEDKGAMEKLLERKERWLKT